MGETTTAPLASALWRTPIASTAPMVVAKVEVDALIDSAGTVTVTVMTLAEPASVLLALCWPAGVAEGEDAKEVVGSTTVELASSLTGPPDTPACWKKLSASDSLTHDRNYGRISAEVKIWVCWDVLFRER